MDRKWWTLITVSVATFMLLLDITVVNTALPAIEEDLNASFTDLQWVIDAYTLSLAALVLTAGSLADRLGRRRVFGVGVGIFTVASLAAGLATDPTMLNIDRAIQGIGGAIMFAVSLALIAQEFAAGRERAMAMATYGATIGIAVAIGPLVGGALTDGLGWRSVFLLNVPIGIAAVAATFTKLRETRDPNATTIDWAGLVTFSSALFLLVLALLRGNQEGWGSEVILGLFGGAAALLAAFVAIERRVREPMLPLHFFRNHAFSGVQVAAFAVSGSMFALFLYLTLYLQNYLGYTPLEAGIRYLPITVAAFLVAPVAGVLLGRLQARVLLAAGLAMAGGGLLLMAGIQATSEWTTLLLGFIVAGIGVGLLNPVIADVALSVVPKEQSGMAAGINDTFRQVGIAVGIAAWGALFQHVVRDEFVKGATRAGLQGAQQRGGQVADFIAFGGARRSGNPQLARLGEQAFVAGLNHLLLLAGLLALAGAALCALLIQPADFAAAHAPAPEPVGSRAASASA